MRVLVVTDNKVMYSFFVDLVRDNVFKDIIFDFRFTKSDKSYGSNLNISNFESIDLRKECDQIIKEYNLVISLHCKQLFPSKLVNSVRCINIHPGLNPHNRGWFPQIFSIINKLPIGVTIHEMDEELDHGPIIIQKELKIYDWETSYDVYKRIQLLEMDLIKENLSMIIKNDYKANLPKSEGNINLKKNFEMLCEIDLDKKVNYRDAIDYFRAMSFKGYKNAYYFDKDGNKIFVEIVLEKEVAKDE